MRPNSEISVGSSFLSFSWIPGFQILSCSCCFLISQPKRSVFSIINFCADALPKLKDFPAAIGGSGDTLPE